MYEFVVEDPSRCTGCKLCEMVCSLSKHGIINPAMSSISVMTDERKGKDVPIVCQQCEDAPCEKICPVNAISRDPETGAYNVDEEDCIGCRMCITVCPFGAINWNPRKRQIEKCDLCGGDPICVKFCETNAIQVKPEEAAPFEKRLEILRSIPITTSRGGEE